MNPTSTRQRIHALRRSQRALERQMHARAADLRNTNESLRAEIARHIRIERDLERRVQERTAEWARANEVLKRKIAERRRIEAESRALKSRLAQDLAGMIRLHEITTRLAPQAHLQQLLEEVVEAAVAITAADMGTIQLFDAASGTLKIVAQRGFGRVFCEFFDTIRPGEAVSGTAMQRGQRVIVEDVAESPIFAGTPSLQVMLAAGARAVQSTPLINHSLKLVGVFSTAYRAPGRPADRELRMLDLLARQAADLIERTQAEEALRESENLLRTIIEASPECIKLVGPEGTLEMINPAGLRLLEADSPADVQGKCVYTFVVPEHRGALQSLNERVFRGESGTLEFDILGCRGTRRTLETNAVPLRDPSGRITSALAISRDIATRKRSEEGIRTRARQQAAVAEIGQRALGGTELSVLMEEACVLVGRTLGVEFCKVLELLPDERLLLRAGVGWKEGLVGRATVGAGVHSQAGYTLLSGAPVLVENLATETRFSAPPLLSEHGVVSGISLIIPGRDRPFGVIGAHTATRRSFSADDAHFIVAVANVLSQAIERKKADEELRKSREELRALATRLQAVREEERSLLAREVHDEFSGALVALKMDLSFLAVARPPEAASFTGRIESMERLIDATLSSLRTIVARLRPGVLDDLGLIAAVEWQTNEFRNRSGIQCDLELEAEEAALERDRATAIFRIFQETLTNVARHAGATRVWISLKERSETLILEIRDNGRGITPQEIASSKSLGLLGIRERALAFGGEVVITGGPGQGTTVALKIPKHPQGTS